MITAEGAGLGGARALMIMGIWSSEQPERHDHDGRCGRRPARKRDEPGRGMRGGVRGGVARRRRDPGQPDGPDPDAGREADAAHVRARPAGHRRGGHPARTWGRWQRRRGLAALPHRVHDGGQRPPAHDDGRRPARPVREPEHLGHRRLGQAQGAAAWRARRARQHDQPPGQLLGAPALPPGLCRAGRHGQRHRLRPRGGSRPGGRPVPRAAPGGDQPGGARLWRARSRHANPLGPPGRRCRRRHRRHRIPAGGPRRGTGDPAAHAGRAGPDPRPARPGRAARPGASASTTGSGLIRTRLTTLLGIRHPIVATGMGYVSGARLTSAASAAGGLGIIASATMSPGELRYAIKEVRERTGAPFGVNLRADAADARERVGLIITERVPVASFAQAPTQELVSRLRDAGVVTIASVGARRHAEKVAAWGIDAVIATGAEGGGHVGAVPTSLLIPQVVDAVEVPVIAAGGFFDGRGLAAALAYGAAGIAMGTRFLLTSDSPVSDAVKRVYLASDVTGTLVTTRADGVPHRLLRTPLVERLDREGRLGGLLRSARSAAAFRRTSTLTWPELIREGRTMRRGTGLTWAQVLMAANIPVLLRAAMVDGHPEAGLMPSGQVTGLIGDLPSCAELIGRVMTDAEQRLAALGDAVKPAR